MSSLRLGIEVGAGSEFEGSLRVDADGPGIIGDGIFGDPAGRYAAALALQNGFHLFHAGAITLSKPLYLLFPGAIHH